MSNFQLPFDARSAIAPWVIASKAMEAFFGFNRDAVGMLRGFGVVPMHAGTSGDNYQAMMSRMMQVGFPLGPDLTFNTLNLKQFRQSDAPWKYCYQALTNARMKITKLNWAGLLGEQRQLLGDVKRRLLDQDSRLAVLAHRRDARTRGIETLARAGAGGRTRARVAVLVRREHGLRARDVTSLIWDDGVWR